MSTALEFGGLGGSGLPDEASMVTVVMATRS